MLDSVDAGRTSYLHCQPRALGTEAHGLTVYAHIRKDAPEPEIPGVDERLRRSGASGLPGPLDQISKRPVPFAAPLALLERPMAQIGASMVGEQEPERTQDLALCGISTEVVAVRNDEVVVCHTRQASRVVRILQDRGQIWTSAEGHDRVSGRELN